DDRFSVHPPTTPATAVQAVALMTVAPVAVGNSSSGIMKKYSYFILMAFMACTSVKHEADTTEVADSIVALPETNIPAVETSVSSEAEVAAPEISDDSTASVLPIDLSSFAQYPLGYGDYASLINYLKEANIEFTDQYKESGLQAINFGESDITVLVTEAYGDLICTARIYNPAFEFPGDVRIG